MESSIWINLFHTRMDRKPEHGVDDEVGLPNWVYRRHTRRFTPTRVDLASTYPCNFYPGIRSADHTQLSARAVV